VFVEFLSKVMITGQGSNVAPSPPLPTPENIHRGTKTTVTSASVIAIPPPPIKEYTYEPAKQERVEKEDDDENDYNEDDNFVEENPMSMITTMSIL